MKIVVGLGNPGERYVGTRHNVGFLTLDTLAKAGSWKLEKSLHATTMKKDSVFFVKPTTFMNNSGQAVAAVLEYFNQTPSDLWVIHDDLDLTLGKAQIRFAGGMAGHHGLESIAKYLKTDQFGRVRIGIRGEELRQYHAQTGIDTNDFVMGEFSPKEQAIIAKIIESLATEFTLGSHAIRNIVV